MRVRGLRGVFVTYSFVAGRNERWVQDRTGHTTSQRLAKYSCVARKGERASPGALAPLASALPGITAAKRQ